MSREKANGEEGSQNQSTAKRSSVTPPPNAGDASTGLSGDGNREISDSEDEQGSGLSRGIVDREIQATEQVAEQLQGELKAGAKEAEETGEAAGHGSG